MAFFCASHRGCTPDTVVTRIEWSPDAVAVAAQVRSRLTQAGVRIESFEVAAP